MSSNGGFPPIKYIDNSKKLDKKNKRFKKERFFNQPVKDLDIKKILNQSVIKPMINLEQNKIDIIDSL
jgi:hypothetical protein